MPQYTATLLQALHSILRWKLYTTNKLRQSKWSHRMDAMYYMCGMKRMSVYNAWYLCIFRLHICISTRYSIRGFKVIYDSQTRVNTPKLAGRARLLAQMRRTHTMESECVKWNGIRAARDGAMESNENQMMHAE